jgi:cytoskeletal protein RodZ
MGYRGKSLKALRETKEIQLRRIANETRIGIVYLEDIEEERFDRFPGKFYFRSFARAYASALDLNVDEVASDLLLAYEDWSGERAAPAPAARPPRSADDRLLHRISGLVRRVEEA